MPTKSVNQKTFYCDPIIVLSVVALMAIGLVMVSSASMVVSEHYYGNPFHFLLHHLVYLALATGLSTAFLMIPTDRLFEHSGNVLLVAFLLLLAVFMPGISHSANGSSRWLKLGPLTLQVSEAVKLCFILYLAAFLTRHQTSFQTQFACFIKPILILGVMSLLLLKQPDFGAVVVLFMTTFSMMLLAGSRWSHMLSVGLVVALCFVGLIVSAPYRLERVTAFLHPWDQQFGSGYQLTQSLMAFGRGGIIGQGLGNSIQKLYYLPEAHTDFIFPVLSEELGLVGALIVFMLFFILTWRMLTISRQALANQLDFNAYLAAGVGIWLGSQAAVNVGVSSGVLPTKGLTLPFISYGGTSLLLNSLAAAMIMRVHHENKQAEAQSKRTQSKVAFV